MKMEVNLKVMTLNCWGIPFISSDRHIRMECIIEEIINGKYDFAALQEVWSNADYDLIAEKCIDVMPYSHYFRSGVIGSGLCILSKGPITDVHFQKWQLNGYAHKIHHADWYGGKGVGLCKIEYCGLKINFYTAHLHAEYNVTDDVYLPHRLCQAFEFSQFVNATGETSDINIVAGDFNAEPKDLVYGILRFNANLSDAHIMCNKPDDIQLGATCEHPRNTYTPKSLLDKGLPGKRIDYILYNYNRGTMITCTYCGTPLDKCTNLDISLSDHEAVVATILVQKTNYAIPLLVSTPDRILVLQKTTEELSNSLQQVAWNRTFYFVVLALLCCMLFGTIYLGDIPVGLQISMAMVRIILTLFVVFCAVMGGLFTTSERNTIIGMQDVLNILLNKLLDR